MFYFHVIDNFIFFQVQLLYNDDSLGANIEFLIKRLEILQTDPPNLERSYNIDRYLSSFCRVSISMVWVKVKFYILEISLQYVSPSRIKNASESNPVWERLQIMSLI
jgi:hypothetical protein